ncbi:MAG: DUF4113 domain-containing protein [Nitrosomonadales bacterium]
MLQHFKFKKSTRFESGLDERGHLFGVFVFEQDGLLAGSGYQYKKTGVLLMGLEPKATLQAGLFDDPELDAKSSSRMHVMDLINQKMGKGTVCIAASGVKQRWAMRRDSKSPNYTTDWNELPRAG